MQATQAADYQRGRERRCREANGEFIRRSRVTSDGRQIEPRQSNREPHRDGDLARSGRVFSGVRSPHARRFRLVPLLWRNWSRRTTSESPGILFAFASALLCLPPALLPLSSRSYIFFSSLLRPPACRFDHNQIYMIRSDIQNWEQLMHSKRKPQGTHPLPFFLSSSFAPLSPSSRIPSFLFLNSLLPHTPILISSVMNIVLTLSFRLAALPSPAPFALPSASSFHPPFLPPPFIFIHKYRSGKDLEHGRSRRLEGLGESQELLRFVRAGPWIRPSRRGKLVCHLPQRRRRRQGKYIYNRSKQIIII